MMRRPGPSSAIRAWLVFLMLPTSDEDREEAQRLLDVARENQAQRNRNREKVEKIIAKKKKAKGSKKT